MRAPTYTYSLGRSLYVPLTCRCNSKTLPETRGPNFALPPDIVSALCRFRDLEEDNMRWSPWCDWLDTQECNQMLPEATNRNKEQCRFSSSIKEMLQTEIDIQLQQKQKSDDHWKEIKFGGEGEPTLNLQTLEALTKEFSSRFENVNIKVMTNGLTEEANVPEALKDWGVSGVSVSLLSHDSQQYNELMEPLVENAHEKLCTFIENCVACNLDVELTSIDRPGIDKQEVQALATNLGVNGEIRWRTFFP